MKFYQITILEFNKRGHTKNGARKHGCNKVHLDQILPPSLNMIAHLLFAQELIRLNILETVQSYKINSIIS